MVGVVMTGHEGTAVCYLLLVLFFVGTAYLRQKSGKPLHAIGLVLLALTFFRQAFSNLKAAGHQLPGWLSEEGVIFANAVLLVLVSVMIVTDEWLEWQSRKADK